MLFRSDAEITGTAQGEPAGQRVATGERGTLGHVRMVAGFRTVRREGRTPVVAPLPGPVAWPTVERHEGTIRWGIDYGSARLSGYYGLAACLKRAFESGMPIRRADALAGLSHGDLGEVFTGRGALQLMERRLDALRELGRGLLSSYEGKAHRLVESAQIGRAHV